MNGGVNSNLVSMIKFSSWVGFLVRRKDSMPLIASGVLFFLSFDPVTVTRYLAHYWVVFTSLEQRLPSH